MDWRTSAWLNAHRPADPLTSTITPAGTGFVERVQHSVLVELDGRLDRGGVELVAAHRRPRPDTRWAGSDKRLTRRSTISLTPSGTPASLSSDLGRVPQHFLDEERVAARLVVDAGPEARVGVETWERGREAR